MGGHAECAQNFGWNSTSVEATWET